MTDFIDRDVMRSKLLSCPSDEITAAFEILDDMPGATSLRNELLHASNQELRQERDELRTAIRNLASKYNELSAEREDELRLVWNLHVGCADVDDLDAEYTTWRDHIRDVLADLRTRAEGGIGDE